MPAQKRCAGPCGQTLPAGAFRPDPARRSGLHPYCRECATLLARRRAKRRVLGITAWVDAAPVRGHVQSLLLAGMTRHQIGEIAGVDRTIIRNLVIGQPPRQGPAKRVRRDNAAALLAVHPAPGAVAPVPPGRSRRAGATIDPTGTRRRVEALLANGWPAQEIARRLGAKTRALQIHTGTRVTSSTAAAVRALYAELADTAGPDPAAATRYRGRGYLPPAWWDADTIDDPRAEPDGIREYDRTGRLLVDHSAWREDRVGWLADQGRDVPEIAAMLGITTKLVRRDLARHRQQVAS